MKAKYKDPKYQNKIKKLQEDICKQAERNKQIMEAYLLRVSTVSFNQRNTLFKSVKKNSGIIEKQEKQGQN